MINLRPLIPCFAVKPMEMEQLGERVEASINSPRAKNYLGAALFKEHAAKLL